MASNDLEILDPAVPAEKSGADVEMTDQQELLRPAADQLNRRFFMAALGVAGAAAGSALFTAKSSEAQQITPHGYAQVDVLNLMLNIKYLKATFYSYITQGADLPGASGVTIGTGQVFNQPAKITFSSQQITDIFNEMYYDELNQLITLRGLLGVAVAGRQTMDILGTGNVKTATVTLTQSQAIAQARLLEDLSASAFTTAAVYLTGNNLQFASQALATDAMHAGAIRLLSIQNNVQYQGAQFASYTTSNTATTSNSFTGETISGSNTIFANLPAPVVIPGSPSPNEPAIGNVLSGIGIPQGAGAVVTGVTYAPNVTFTAISNKNTTLTLVSSIANLQAGQPITGTYIAAGTYIVNTIGTNTVTLSAATTTASVVAPTGFVTSGSPTVTGVSSTSGLINGQAITGTGIPPGTTVMSSSSSASTITMSANATISSVATVTGVVTSGSAVITNLSNFAPLVIGQPITGAGIPTTATIVGVTNTSATISANATANSATGGNLQGIVTSGSPTISGIPSTTGVAVGQLLAGTGIPTGAKVTAVTANSITSSANATASSFITPAPSASTVQGSNVLTQLSSPTGISVGQTITSTGIPASTTITAVGTNTLTISNAATFTNSSIPISVPAPETVYYGGESLTSPTTEAVTSPAIVTYSVAQSVVTIAGTPSVVGGTPGATATGFNTFSIVLPDNQDVEPGDPGTASVSANGPSLIAGTAPPIYQGFFNTAGTGTTGSTATPPGFAFARSFQQILAVLYGYNSTNSQIATQNYEGGFFPVGVSGPINTTI